VYCQVHFQCRVTVWVAHTKQFCGNLCVKCTYNDYGHDNKNKKRI